MGMGLWHVACDWLGAALAMQSQLHCVSLRLVHLAIAPICLIVCSRFCRVWFNARCVEFGQSHTLYSAGRRPCGAVALLLVLVISCAHELIILLALVFVLESHLDNQKLGEL